jgi:hypothetical protein
MLIPNALKPDGLGGRLDVFSDPQDPATAIHDPLTVIGVRLVYPMVVAPRINAQSGFFTIQHDPWKSLDELEDVEYDEDDLDIIRLTSYTVPGEQREHLLQELQEQGISRRNLFPDLDGLSAGLLNSQILRRVGGGK